MQPCCSGKAIIIIYSECVSVALLSNMQCACGIFFSVACPALQCFSTVSHKQHHFRLKKVVGHEMRVLIFFTTFVRNIYHSKNN